jgi:hypothetical protein
LAVLCGTSWAAPQERPLDLTRATLEGCTLRGGAVVPSQAYTLAAGQVLWVEAEDPGEVHAPAEVSDDPDGSGGQVAWVPDQGGGAGAARIALTVDMAQEGDYRLSGRTFWPDVGGNSFYLQLDGADREVWGNDEQPDHLGRWFWLVGPSWHLTAGLHTIVVWWREDGAKLDKLALGAADFVPQGLGEAAATPALVRRMSVTLPPFGPPQVTRWLRAEVQLDGGAKPSLAALTRQGPRDCGDGGSLSELAPGPLTLRLTLEPTPETALRGVTLVYDGEPWSIELTTPRTKVVFDRGSGELVSLANAAGGDSACRSASRPGPMPRASWPGCPTRASAASVGPPTAAA